MTEQKRGKNVALLGAGLQTLFVVVMLIVASWTRSAAALACVWILAAGVPVWLMTVAVFYCQQLQRREAVELDDLAGEGGAAGTIFEGEQLDAHRAAAARVRFVYRWVVPIFTLLWAAGNAAAAYTMLQWVRRAGESLAANAAPASLFAVLVGFLAFLFSAYTLGMSRQGPWRLLRAPAGYLAVCVWAVAGVLAALVAAWQEYPAVDRVVAYAIPIGMAILALELAVNFVLDLYRPRMPGAEDRLMYDSRLFGLVAQPQHIGRSIAETLNYQFGFEVSKTWFFGLLSRAALPLLLTGLAVMLLMSSVVVVDEGEVCVVSHWGDIDSASGPLGPGLHLKWPWPVDTARHFDTRIRSIQIGAGKARDARSDIVEGGTFDGRELALWTIEHGEFEEKDFLVAVPPRERKSTEKKGGKVPAVNITRLIGSLQYCIEDPYKFGYQYVNAEAVLQDIVHREMVRYCSSATLFEPAGGGQTDRPEAIMTYGRERLGRELLRRVRAAVSGGEADLGVEIVSLNFRAVHPPLQAADAYQQVLRARLGREIQRFQAQAFAGRRYFGLASEPGDAQLLAIALRRAKGLALLSAVQRQGGKLAPHIDSILGRVQRDLNDLDKSIHRETLLGKDRAGEQTMTARVRHSLNAYAEQLEQIRSAEQARRSIDLSEAVAEADRAVGELFKRTSGQPARLVAEARAQGWTFQLAERGRAAVFPAQLEAYRASPDIYMLDRYLDVWDEVLPSLPKYVIGIDPDRIEPWLNLEQGKSFQEKIDFSAAGGGSGDQP